MKNFKKNQVVIFVIALMLVTAGYLNFTNQQGNQNLLPTSALADSEQMAAIGDATLVNANQVTENVQQGTNVEASNNVSSGSINSANKNLIENSLEMIEFNMNFIQSTRMSPGNNNYDKNASAAGGGVDAGFGTGSFDAKQ